MGSKSSKRERFRGLLKDTGRSLSDLFRSSSPTPSSSGAHPTQDFASATLEAALKALRKSASEVPALKSFVDILADCVGNIPTMAKNHKDYEDLALSIATTVNGLKEHLDGTNHGQMIKVIEKVIEELNQQANCIAERQGRTKARTYIAADADIDGLIGCCRQIESLLRQLQIVKNAGLAALNPAKTARYDSIVAFQLGRGGCSPNTRRLVLQKLHDWANDPNGSKVYWMNGMAGTGKTTIAYSFCTKLEESHQLAASFFCTRSLPECRDVSRITTTIADQLAYFCRPIKHVLHQVLENDDVIARTVTTQFQKLVAQPLRKVKDSLPVGRLVVVIDALDECSGRGDARMFLDTLLSFAQDLPIKFFVTSRPDDALLSKLTSSSNVHHSLLHLHDIEKSLVQADIETYLSSELEAIRMEASKIRRLAEKSGALFIFAATVVRYIALDDSSIDHRERLETILDDSPHPSNKMHAPLDLLYTTILSFALDNENLDERDKENIELLLHTVVFAREPLSVESLTRLLRLKNLDQAMRAIKPLQSVLHVDERSGLVSTLHASFPDYIRSPSRSNRFHRDEAKHSNLLAEMCFEAMKQMLRFNMCDLESSYVLDDQVPDMQIRIGRSISSHLFYACRYWSDYLVLADNSSDLLPHVQELLYHRMLSWVEVMNLKRSTSAGVAILAATYRWMKSKEMSDEDCVVCQDAQKFVTVVGANPVGKSTPHIYISVLALWDKSDPMWVHYGARMRPLVQARGTAIENRESAVLAVWQARASVFSISVSPDGSRAASGHHDGTVCVWDTHTGDMVLGPIKAHTGDVYSVAFSPDSARLVSGSADK
ncbi:hypothetical protein FRC07_000678, partial [Ceratobasidium sp. 392]